MNKKLLFFKKTAALLLCAVLLLPCSACFNSPEAKNPGNDTGQITDSPHSETRNEAFNDYVNRHNRYHNPSFLHGTSVRLWH